MNEKLKLKALKVILKDIKVSEGFKHYIFTNEGNNIELSAKINDALYTFAETELGENNSVQIGSESIIIVDENQPNIPLIIVSKRGKRLILKESRELNEIEIEERDYKNYIYNKYGITRERLSEESKTAIAPELTPNLIPYETLFLLNVIKNPDSIFCIFEYYDCLGNLQILHTSLPVDDYEFISYYEKDRQAILCGENIIINGEINKIFYGATIEKSLVALAREDGEAIFIDDFLLQNSDIVLKDYNTNLLISKTGMTPDKFLNKLKKTLRRKV